MVLTVSIRDAGLGRVVGHMLIVSVVSICVACENRGHPSEADTTPPPSEESLTSQQGFAFDGTRKVDTLVTTESGLIAESSDLFVHDDGTLYVADAVGNAIHVFGPDGVHAGSIGREGQGPGELVAPTLVWSHGDSVLVVDAGNNRVQVLERDGTYRSSRPVIGGYPATVVSPSGWQVRALLGMDSTLATIRDPDGVERARIGEPLAPPTATISMSRIEAEIADGGVPDIFLNTAEVLFGPDDEVWLFVPAAGLVERYELDGHRLLTRVLTEPEFERAFEAYQARNRNSPGGRVVQLEYLRRARALGDELWILLGNGDGPATILVLSNEAVVLRKLRFPEIADATDFVVDDERGRIYFSVRNRAELLRVSTESSTN